MRTFLILKREAETKNIYIAEVVKSETYPSDREAFRIIEIPNEGSCHIQLITKDTWKGM